MEVRKSGGEKKVTEYVARDYYGAVFVYQVLEKDKEEAMLKGVGYICYGRPDELRPATPEEIEEFKRKTSEREDRIRKQEQEEKKILAQIGLKPSDFCRFREVYEDSNHITVCTRENGVYDRSTEAIRKAGDLLEDTSTDDTDPTYQYYVFKKNEAGSDDRNYKENCGGERDERRSRKENESNR